MNRMKNIQWYLTSFFLMHVLFDVMICPRVDILGIVVDAIALP
jgi:hypothetical protein